MNNELRVTEPVRYRMARWEAARIALERAKADLGRIECELLNAENALGFIMTPIVAKRGEVFAIWAFGGLLEVEVVEKTDTHGTFKCKWREKPEEPVR